MNKPKIFKTDHVATFLDLDPCNHVNTVHYVRFFLEHRFHGLKERAGLGLKEITQLPIAFYTTSLNFTFQKSLVGDTAFTIKSWVESFDDTNCTVVGEIEDAKGKLATKASMELTCISKETGRRCAWPSGFMELFYENEVAQK